MFRQDFAGRFLEFDELAARQFAEIASSRRKAGRPIAELDAQIAAIADVHDAVLPRAMRALSHSAGYDL